MTKHREGNAKDLSHGGLSRRSFVGSALSLPAIVAASRARAADPVRIGWIPSLTGPLATAAIGFDHGVRFAVEELNAKGGIGGRPIELIVRDTGSDPTRAVNFAQQLLFSEKIHFMLGPVNSGESLATIPVVSRAGIPNMVTGAVEELIDPVKYPLAFRLANTTTQWITVGNDYVVNTMKLKKIAIAGDTTGYGTSSVKRATDLLKPMNVQIVSTFLVDPNKTDLSDEMNKARAAGAEVIMPWTAASGLAARLINTRGDMGWAVPIIGHPVVGAPSIKPLLNKPEYWENTFATGYRSTSFGKDGKLPPRTQALIDAIRPKLGGKDIDFNFWWIALGYDCVKVVDYAVQKANSIDPAAIKKVLESTSDLPMVFANYTWTPSDHNGVPDKSVVVNVANTFRDGCYLIAEA
jgi:branched-chain amino acid transport system substrate-binding protein